MSTHPSLESRVKALEHRQYSLETHTEELFAGIVTGVKHLSGDMIAVKTNINQMSDDMTAVKAEVKHLSGDMTVVKADIKRLFNNMTASFTQMVQYDMRIEGQIDARFNKIEVDIADIRATMATKDDIATVKADIATVKADIVSINERLDRLETAFGEHTTLLTQILERLPA